MWCAKILNQKSKELKSRNPFAYYSLQETKAVICGPSYSAFINSNHWMAKSLMISFSQYLKRVEDSLTL